YLLTLKDKDPRVIKQPKAQLGRVIVDLDAEQSRVHLEGLHQLERQFAAKQISIVLLRDAVCRLRQVFVELDERVVHDDQVREREATVDVVGALVDLVLDAWIV